MTGRFRLPPLAVMLWLGLIWLARLDAAPVIQQITPTIGGAGAQVIITGSDLAGVRTVSFSGTLADFAVVSASQLVATVPAAAITGFISVEAANGVSTSKQGFVAAPRIDSFDPVRAGTNNLVTIFGANFDNAIDVKFGDISTLYIITASSQIRTIVPPGATNGPISVTTAAGKAVSTNDFLVTGPGPIIDEFTPAAGAPGAEILIKGVNFTNVSAVRFGGVASAFQVTAQTQVRALVPNGGLTGPIIMTTPGGSYTSKVSFVVTTAPVITSFEPTNGVAGTQVTIRGINFKNVTDVKFGGKSVTGLAVPAEGQILVTVPAGATTGVIEVKSAAGSNQSTNTFTINTGPIINSINPEIGRPGSTVVINGANFTGLPATGAVKFNGVNAAYAVTAATQIQAIVPGTATTGPITITNGTQGAVSGIFTVIGSKPFITTLTPNNGPRGAQITLTGFNFTGATAVKFNGLAATAIEVTADTQVRATVPPGVTSGLVTLTTPAGDNTNQVFFFAPPRLSSFAPTSAIAGTSVVIKGTNLIGATLRLGSIPVPFTVDSTNQITTVIPTNAVTALITAQNSAGTFTSTNYLFILPNIESFSPDFGPTNTTVSIFGSGFEYVTNVTVGGVSAAYTVKSLNQIDATVPPAATTGAITVRTYAGTSTSTNSFLVTGPATVNLLMSGPPGPLSTGSNIVYTLTLTNLGPKVVAGTVVSNTLPKFFQLVSSDASRGSISVSSNIVRWDVGFLTNQTSVRLSLTGHAAQTGILTNVAAVTFNNGGVVQGTQLAGVTTLVISDIERTLNLVPLFSQNGFVITWPKTSASFLVETTESLTPPVFWEPLGVEPQVVNGEYRLLLGFGGQRRFYRLRLQ